MTYQYLLKMQNEEGRISLIPLIFVYWDCKKKNLPNSGPPFPIFLITIHLSGWLGLVNPYKEDLGTKLSWSKLRKLFKHSAKEREYRNWGLNSTQLQTAEVYGMYSEILVRCLETVWHNKVREEKKTAFHSKQTLKTNLTNVCVAFGSATKCESRKK